MRFLIKILLFVSLLAPGSLFAQGPGGVSTNLRIWLKAGNGVTGNPVSNWADQSSSGFNAAQATVNQRPAVVTNRVNFNPTIQFDGTNDNLVVANGIFATSTVSDVYVFGVYRNNTVSNSSVFYEPLNGGGRFNTHIPWGDNNLYWDAGSTNANQRISTPWASSTGVPYIWTLTASTTSTPSGARQDVIRNGLILANDNNMTSFTGNNSNLNIGNGFGAYNGEIAEFIVYRGAATAASMQRIHSYLAIKYGITLDQSTAQNYVSSTGTVIWNGTTLAAHKNAITGIGRDDNATLSQLKSTSINVDVITVANSNFASPTNFGSDLQFLLWGHDGNAVSADATASSFVQNGVTIVARILRTWRTSVSGSPTGNAIVQFDMTTVGGGTSANANLRLLIDDDGVFGNSSAGEAIISPTSGFAATGGTVDFSVPYANLAGNAYFTLGSTDLVASPLSAPSPGGVTAATRLWLKADVGVTGSPVSSWVDQSGNAFNLTQGTVANRPAFTSALFNFNPGLTFNGSSTQLTTTSGVMGSSTYTDFHAFVVGSTAAVAAGSIFFESQASSGRINTHIPWSDGNLYWDAGSASSPQRLSTAWTGTVNVPYVWGLLASTSSTPTGVKQEVYKNGNLLASDNDMSAFTGINSTFYLGSLSGANFFNGRVSELIFLTGTLNTADLQRIQSYLAAKYGITLDQTTPRNYYASNWNGTTGTTMWDATTGGSYKQDIAVIGRDDNSGLNQKQSASVNSGNILSIGLGSIDATNSANVNTFTATRTFFSWAHNGLGLDGLGVTDFGTTTNSEIIRARIPRVWKGQETGTVGTVKVRIDFTTIAGTNDLANARLLVDGDGVFATGATSIAPTTFSNITKIADFDVDFTAGTGFFFTVGSTNRTTTPLPIELVAFEARTNGNQVDLFWKTATELNNDRFEVQVTSDGEQWTTRYSVAGQGTRHEPYEYQLVDHDPFSGTSYYRLKQVDYDGKYSFSPIRRVDFEPREESVFPNPVTDLLTIQLAGASRGVAVSVSNITGDTMYRADLDETAPTQKIEVSTSQWPAGMYILRIFEPDGKTRSRKVLKAR